MKKLSSVFYMWIGFAAGILAVLMMFLPCLAFNSGNTIVSAKDLFWGEGTAGGAWPAFVGYMLILFGSLITGILALPFIQPTVKAEKIVLISSAICLLAGAVLVGLIKVEYFANNGYYRYFSYYAAGYFITLSLAAITFICDIIALMLDW